MPLQGQALSAEPPPRPARHSEPPPYPTADSSPSGHASGLGPTAGEFPLVPTAGLPVPALTLLFRPHPLSTPGLTNRHAPAAEFKQQQAALLVSSLAVLRDVSRAPAPAVSAWGGRAAPCGARGGGGRPRGGREGTGHGTGHGTGRSARGMAGADGRAGGLWLRVSRRPSSGGNSLQPLPPARAAGGSPVASGKEGWNFRPHWLYLLFQYKYPC